MVLQMFYWESISNREIAGALGVRSARSATRVSAGPAGARASVADIHRARSSPHLVARGPRQLGRVDRRASLGEPVARGLGAPGRPATLGACAGGRLRGRSRGDSDGRLRAAAVQSASTTGRATSWPGGRCEAGVPLRRGRDRSVDHRGDGADDRRASELCSMGATAGAAKRGRPPSRLADDGGASRGRWLLPSAAPLELRALRLDAAGEQVWSHAVDATESPSVDDDTDLWARLFVPAADELLISSTRGATRTIRP